ncbi:MAG TPA: TrmH family RNA methyltransferase, partial [Solirubrobacterales bacterium]|nr:TrmH family RNA methyltransferase [Solirubrobacterales bacterium]
LGAEREGLPPEVAGACDVRVTIPLREGVESLNVAAAAAIALHRICEGAPHMRGRSERSDSFDEVRSNPSCGEAGKGSEDG